MTLEITVAETIRATDVLETVLNLFKWLTSWFKPVDDSADTPDVEDEEDNKSPPADTQQPQAADDSGANPVDSPQDLSIQVSDESKAGESFGP